VLRWWRQRCRERRYGDGSESGEAELTLPCRLSVLLKGVEVCQYNAGTRAKEIEALRRRRAGEESAVPVTQQQQQQQQQQEQPGPITDDERRPLMYRIAPITEVTIERGSLMFGNPVDEAALPSVTVVSYERAEGYHYIVPSKSPLDYYKVCERGK
jgi:hypothetical protein